MGKPSPLGINSLANSSSLRSDLYPARLFIPAGFGFSRSVINRIDILIKNNVLYNKKSQSIKKSQVPIWQKLARVYNTEFLTL